jgi:hypothetical protein
LLEGAQLRLDSLGRDMPVLSQAIDAVTNRREEIAVACRLLEAFGGGWNSHIRESRNRAGCSPRRDGLSKRGTFQIGLTRRLRQASSSPVTPSVSGILDRWVVALLVRECLPMTLASPPVYHSCRLLQHPSQHRGTSSRSEHEPAQHPRGGLPQATLRLSPPAEKIIRTPI